MLPFSLWPMNGKHKQQNNDYRQELWKENWRGCIFFAYRQATVMDGLFQRGHLSNQQKELISTQKTSYEHCLGLLSLVGHESLLLQPLRLLWNEQTVSEQLKESAETLPHSQTVAWRRPVFPSGVRWWGGVQHARVHPLISQVIQWTLCPQSSFVIELQSIPDNV